jgi:hypothetical protein
VALVSRRQVGAGVVERHMEKFLRFTHIMPATDKILCNAFRRESMTHLGVHDKKNCAEIFIVDFTKVGVLDKDDPQ